MINGNKKLYKLLRRNTPSLKYDCIFARSSGKTYARINNLLLWQSYDEVKTYVRNAKEIVEDKEATDMIKQCFYFLHNKYFGEDFEKE